MTRSRLSAAARYGTNAILSPAFFFPAKIAIPPCSAAAAKAISESRTAGTNPVNNPLTIRHMPSPSPILSPSAAERSRKTAPGTAPAHILSADVQKRPDRFAATAAAKNAPGIQTEIL